MVGGKLKWVPLGQDLTAARLKWAELENVIDNREGGTDLCRCRAAIPA
jgi:hypothetical protein